MQTLHHGLDLRICFSICMAECCCRFIQKNLLVEITSNARLARLFGWLLRRHTFVSYSLYTAGAILLISYCTCVRGSGTWH
jgi:hypothetical protein